MSRPRAAVPCLVPSMARGLAASPAPVLLLLAHAAAAVAALRLPDAGLQQATSVTLTEFMGVQYHGDLTIGGQTLPLIYDTGSFDVLVISSLCGNCKAKVPIYEPAKSKTLRKGTEAKQEMFFGSGPVTVQENNEKISFGDGRSPLVLRKAPFWQVLEHDLKPWKAPGGASFAGIFGLPMVQDSPDHPAGTSADDTVLKLLQLHQFAICLGPLPMSPGYVTFDPKLEALESSPGFKTVDVVGKVHWGVTLSNVALGNATADVICNPTCGAIVDSGTSLIGAPKHAIGLLNQVLKNLAADCSNLAELPHLRFRLGDKDFLLPPEGYVLKVHGGVACTPAFQEVERGSPFGPVWLLGLPFLRYHYVVFDRASPGEKKLHIGAGQPCGPRPPQEGAGDATQLHRSGASAVHSADWSFARLPDWAAGDSPFVF